MTRSAITALLILIAAAAGAQPRPRADQGTRVEACHTTRNPAQTPWKKGDSVLCDLDGDGALDHVRVTFREDGWSFLVQVNHLNAAGSGASLDETFAIVDIDTLDAHKEIAVTENAGNPDHVTHFYGWDGIEVYSMGAVPGSEGIVVDGSGEIRAKVRGQLLQTWWYEARYRLEKDHKIVRLRGDLHPMNSTVVVTKSLQLLRSRENPAPGPTLAPGDTVTIVSSDDVEWCHVRNARGQSGWFSIDESGLLKGTKLRPQDVFKGLRFED